MKMELYYYTVLKETENFKKNVYLGFVNKCDTEAFCAQYYTNDL